MTKNNKPLEGEVVSEKTTKPKKKTDQGGMVKAEAPTLVSGVTTEDLKVALKTQTEQRDLISKFIKKHLKKDVDFIRIHVVRGCSQENAKRGSCKNTYHFSKDILAKPGQEKIFSLFSLTSELVKDVETIEMLEGARGLVAYKCIVRRGDQIVAEGRGAATVGDKGRDANATIKIAEKRARMDACLSLGFSEYFAQDLDDPDYQNQKRAAEEQAANRAEATQKSGDGLPARPANAPIDDQERKILAKWMIKLGFDTGEQQVELLKANGITDPSKMTSSMARGIIQKLSGNAFNKPTTPAVVTASNADDVSDDELETPDFGPDPEPTKPVEKEPELVIDDDLKANAQEMFKTIGLNTQGEMWFMRKATGRPYLKWDAATDEEWRKIHDLITEILDGLVDLEDYHMAGYKEGMKKNEQRAKVKTTKGGSK